MANDTTITVRGRAGTAPRLMENDRGVWTSFRLAHTPRVRTSESTWVDGNTTWYTVSANGEFAARVAANVDKGSPVLVRGRLEVARYTDAGGNEREELRLKADSLGLDVNTTGQLVWRKAPTRGAVTDVTSLRVLPDTDDDEAPADPGLADPAADADADSDPGARVPDPEPEPDF